MLQVSQYIKRCGEKQHTGVRFIFSLKKHLDGHRYVLHTVQTISR